MTGRGRPRLPMVIFSKVRSSASARWGQKRRLATLIILAVAIGVAIATWQMHRRMKEARRD